MLSCVFQHNILHDCEQLLPHIYVFIKQDPWLYVEDWSDWHRGYDIWADANSLLHRLPQLADGAFLDFGTDGIALCWQLCHLTYTLLWTWGIPLSQSFVLLYIVGSLPRTGPSRKVLLSYLNRDTWVLHAVDAVLCLAWHRLYILRDQVARKPL